MSRQGSVLNVGIEKGELLMEEAMMGYAMCYRMNGANSSAELKTVVQGKYSTIDIWRRYAGRL